jgi:excisionase family DNA binding protein
LKKLGGYLRTWTAAEYLGIPLAELEKMLESGEIPGVQFDGKWRVPLAELERWLDEEVSEKEIKDLAGHLDMEEKAVDEFLTEEKAEESDGSN